MKTISIDEDVYQFLLRNTQELGEGASDILRRLLNIPRSANGNISQSNATKHEFSEIFNDSKFLWLHTAVDKFLYFLSQAYSEHQSDFEKLLVIQGRGRTYFATSSKEIEDSGQSTQPRNIPGSPYWVMTNSPTPQKRQMLREALSILGYSETGINAATNLII